MPAGTEYDDARGFIGFWMFMGAIALAMRIRSVAHVAPRRNQLRYFAPAASSSSRVRSTSARTASRSTFFSRCWV